MKRNIFKCGAEHQLDPVQLIYFTGSWVIINGYDVGFRAAVSELLDDAFSYDMVWQAGKRLGPV